MRANDASFEIRVPSQLAGGDFGCGIPKRPFVRPETGLGGRGHFRGETRSRSSNYGEGKKQQHPFVKLQRSHARL